MIKSEAIEYSKEFIEKLKKEEDIKLRPREKAMLSRFIHWIYDEGWTISGR